jgi:hypothetical protein
MHRFWTILVNKWTRLKYIKAQNRIAKKLRTVHFGSYYSSIRILRAVYMVPLTRNSMKCDVFWAIEISRTSWSNKIACYKLYEIPCFRQKNKCCSLLLIVFFHYITFSAFLISFKQYLKLSNFCLGLKHVFQLLKIRHTSFNPGYKRDHINSPFGLFQTSRFSCSKHI